jgi:hypothetical protein
VLASEVGIRPCFYWLEAPAMSDQDRQCAEANARWLKSDCQVRSTLRHPPCGAAQGGPRGLHRCCLAPPAMRPRSCLHRGLAGTRERWLLAARRWLLTPALCSCCFVLAPRRTMPSL